MQTSTIWIILGIIVLVIIGWTIGIYNKLIHMIEAIRNNERQIDIQLDRRFKVFESLISAVKQYMDYEKTTLKDVVALRNQANTAKDQGNQQARMEAENAISKIASGLNVVFEQYPDLKAHSNVLQLQEEIVNTENKLAYAKQAYNDSIERYNATKKSFFESYVVGMFRNQLDFTFPYWNIDQATRDKQEAYTVKF
jgi:LemA protein